MIFLSSYDFIDGIYVSLISIAIVFAILYLITLTIKPLQYIKPKQKHQTYQMSVVSLDDPDAVVAMMVASIDYREQTKSDVRVISIKEKK